MAEERPQAVAADDEARTRTNATEEMPARGRGDAPASEARPQSRLRFNLALFWALAIAWLAADIATKAFFSMNYSAGDVITEPIMGIFRFHLVHNTGAAWGMFANSTVALGVISLLVCVGILVLFMLLSKRANPAITCGLALVLGGGLGNAIDRFTLGYVVDFIEPTFIDFPVFNVADMGVTCGFVIFMAGYFLFDARRSK